MKFAITSLLQFININNLPKDINKLKQQLINLGIEVESITQVNNNQNNFNDNNIENYILEVAVAANRADLLSIMGIARELAIINNATFNLPDISNIIFEQSRHLNFKVQILASKVCPKYLSLIIKDLNIKELTTPDWIKVFLENMGFSLISPIVDITNYVMFELGQPLHAFDLNKIANNHITVRYALPNESITLLNNRTIILDPQDLVIADHNKVLALAGIMGGVESSITNETYNILLECAYFEPIGIRKSVLRHNLLTDAAQRFTRNIDANLQELALKRCYELIQEISNFKIKNTIPSYYEILYENHLPAVNVIKLEYARIKQILGIELSVTKIHQILTNLGIKIVDLIDSSCELTIPTWRNDLKIQEDIIEELARFIGYHNVVPEVVSLPLNFKRNIVNSNNLSFNNLHQELQFKNFLSNRGYQEIISYSFIDLEFVKKFYSTNFYVENFYRLKNPISQNMNIMRDSLLPGLINALIYNQNRQHTRVKIFEVGNVFISRKNQYKFNKSDITNNINTENNQFIETKKIAGLVNGKMFKENWQFNQDIDFYKLKNDVICFINMLYREQNINFIPINSQHLELHPYQSAFISVDDINIGIIGALHPELLMEFEINNPVYIFELDLNLLIKSVKSKKYQPIPKFPAIRRDFSILINLEVGANKIYEVVYNSCGILFKELIFFDVYLGDKLLENKKSIAFGVILQHPERTLIDEEINEISNKIINNLSVIGAQLRS